MNSKNFYPDALKRATSIIESLLPGASPSKIICVVACFNLLLPLLLVGIFSLVSLFSLLLLLLAVIPWLGWLGITAFYLLRGVLLLAGLVWVILASTHALRLSKNRGLIGLLLVISTMPFFLMLWVEVMSDVHLLFGDNTICCAPMPPLYVDEAERINK